MISDKRKYKVTKYKHIDTINLIVFNMKTTNQSSAVVEAVDSIAFLYLFKNRLSY